MTTLLLEPMRSRQIQGKQVHDANIVAAMQRHGISWLLTNNAADFERHRAEIHILSLTSEV